MRPIPFIKPISLLGIFQFVICIVGFMFTATVMKTYWVGEPVPEYAAASRNRWLFLLLIPAAWTLFASWDIEYDALPVSYKFHFISGIALCAMLIWLWIGIASTSYPTLIQSISTN